MKKLLFGSLVCAVAAAAFVAGVGWASHAARGSAHEFPGGCNTSAVSFPVPTLDAPGVIPPVRDGTLVGYRVLVSLPRLTLPPDPIEVLCALSNVDVYIRLPGERKFDHVCSFETIHEGEALLCTTRPVYEVDPLDAVDGRLRAQVRIIADVHNGDVDCSVPDKKRNPLRVTDCVDATALMSLPITEEPAR